KPGEKEEPIRCAPGEQFQNHPCTARLAASTWRMTMRQNLWRTTRNIKVFPARVILRSTSKPKSRALAAIRSNLRGLTSGERKAKAKGTTPRPAVRLRVTRCNQDIGEGTKLASHRSGWVRDVQQTPRITLHRNKWRLA
ncbi:hypothetical protein LOZ10_006562, partial [Ophidiomyces ophidiicola]